MRVAIIGGGIAGLSAAYELERARLAGADVAYELFEAGSRFGGVIASKVIDGTVLEGGPDSFLTEKPAAAELCRELGLEDDLIGSDDAARKTFIVIRNRLVTLPDGLMFLIPTRLIPTALSGLFSLRTKLLMGWELLRSARPHSRDESVASLVRRHYGQEVVDRLADPLLSGIYGGSAEELSAQSVLPRLVEMEGRYGSLTRGMLAVQRARKVSAVSVQAAEKPIFTSLRFGLQQLIDALLARLNAECLHTQTRALSVARVVDRWRIAIDEGVQSFDAVIVATPASVAGELLSSVDRELADQLIAIPYSSSVTVNLVYDELELKGLPAGFGFLVPAVEGRAILACTFIHRKFKGRTAKGKAVLRAFVGGVRNERLLEESDEVLINLVRKDLHEILGIDASPERVEIKRWPRAMAQYAVGHKARLERIQERLKALPGVYLAGNAYDGIGISDCIRLGRGAAKQIVAEVTLQAAQAIVQSHR